MTPSTTTLNEQQLADAGFHARNATTRSQRGRATLYRDLATYNRISSTASGANCFRSRRGGSTGTPLYKTHTSKGVHARWGRQSCKGAFCPVCSTQRARQDAAELIVATRAHVKRGGTALFLTLSARSEFSRTPQFENAEYLFRRDKEAFAEFREQEKGYSPVGASTRLEARVAQYAEELAVEVHTHKGWELNERHEAMKRTLSRSVFGGSSWSKDEKRYNVRSRVIVTELVPTPARKKLGASESAEPNWNYVRHNLHFHILLFIDPKAKEYDNALFPAHEPTTHRDDRMGTRSEVHARLNAEEREEFVSRLYGRWERALKKAGLVAEEAAQDFSWIAADDIEKVAHYINKLPRELLEGKSAGKEGHASVWDALRAADGGVISESGELIEADPAARNWFRQMEQVFYRKKLIVFSTNFAEKMGVADELKARREEFLSTAIKETVLLFGEGAWEWMCEENPEFRYELLNMAENTTSENLKAFIREHGYPFIEPATPTLDDVEDDPFWDMEPF